MIVLDASAMVAWLVGVVDKGPAVAEQVRRAGALNTLDLADLEVMSALRREVSSGALEESRAEEALSDLGLIRVRRHIASPFRGRIWELRESHAPYDAAYIALAEALDMPLVTTDGRLARSRGHRARIVEAGAVP